MNIEKQCIDAHSKITVEQCAKVILNHDQQIEDITFHLKKHSNLIYFFDYAAVATNQTYALKFILEESSTLHAFFLITHSVSLSIDIQLQGEHANAQIHGLYALKDRQQCSIITRQHHQAQHTKSDVLVRGILNDHAKSDYHGTIFVHQPAKYTCAVQENKNLLLSSHARANSVPSLEVLTNDVQCKHGSAVGQLDMHHLYYLQSRGIEIKQAKKMLIRGFFSNIVASLDETMVSQIYDRIEHQTMV